MEAKRLHRDRRSLGDADRRGERLRKLRASKIPTRSAGVERVGAGSAAGRVCPPPRRGRAMIAAAEEGFVRIEGFGVRAGRRVPRRTYLTVSVPDMPAVSSLPTDE